MKSLETIQKLAKVGLVLCRIKLVCSLIGFFGCIAAIGCALYAGMIYVKRL